MSNDILFISSWITAAILLSAAWFVYCYSKNEVVAESFWKYIVMGMVFFAASEIARPLFILMESLFWAYWIFSAAGGIMVAYGFYMLYNEEKV